MLDQLLEILCCPKCGSNLDLEILVGYKNSVKKGYLNCLNCKSSFEVINDIPYFAEDIQHNGIRNQYTTYSYWFEKMHDETSVTKSENNKIFYDSLRIRKDEFKNKIVLDAGCGNGRFSYVVSKYNPGLLISFDISRGLEEAKRVLSEKSNQNSNIAFVQGDITRPPFKKEAFDIVYSWGVVHHTPNTKRTVKELSKLVKENGIFGIYVYVFNPPYQYEKQLLSLVAYLRSIFLIRPFRFICSRLPAKFVQFIFLPIYYLERLFGFGIFGNHSYKNDSFDKEKL